MTPDEIRKNLTAEQWNLYQAQKSAKSDGCYPVETIDALEALAEANRLLEEASEILNRYITTLAKEEGKLVDLDGRAIGLIESIAAALKGVGE